MDTRGPKVMDQESFLFAPWTAIPRALVVLIVLTIIGALSHLLVLIEPRDQSPCSCVDRARRYWSKSLVVLNSHISLLSCLFGSCWPSLALFKSSVTIPRIIGVLLEQPFQELDNSFHII